MKIQPPNQELVGFGRSREDRSSLADPPFSGRESIHSLSVYRWLSLEHKLMTIEPDVKDGAPDDAYSQTRNYKISRDHLIFLG